VSADPFSLDGKRILVTGASSGLGRAIAIGCSQRGATIVATGRDELRLSETMGALCGIGHISICADLNKAEDRDQVTLLAGSIHGLVHAAGIAALAPVRQASAAHIEAQMGTNFVSPMLLTQNLLQRNAIQAGGAILFISSIAAHVGVRGVGAYSATKAALEAAARCLSMEVAKKNIRVNCLAPGEVRTPLFDASMNTTGNLAGTLASYPLGLGLPEDVANAAIFFLSPASRWVTGTTLILDGGHTVG
jgi:NAD(P)-dependent dehydrogenase (short-subunit alcohol dehydrogenase family)